MILLTDGWGGGGTGVDLAEQMRAQGVTLTVVAAGSGSAGYLEELASAGGGRFYGVADIAHVPQIFVQETITTVGNYIVERPVLPVAAGDSPVLAGLGGLPPLYGFNGSTLKDSARPVLVTADDQTLLATWQFGLGRSAAWLSDAKGQWAADWLAWEGFPRFAAQLAGWVLPVRGGERSTADALVSGGEAVVRLTLAGAGTGAEGGAFQVRATLIAPDGERRELPLPQTAPAVYQARLTSPQPGTYIVQVAGVEGERVLIQETAGLVVPYSPEYGDSRSNPALLRALAAQTGGTSLTAGADAFAPAPMPATRPEALGLPLLALALALLPLDILIRRISVRTRR